MIARTPVSPVNAARLRDIESLADPEGGEVQIGCPESIAAFLALVIERLATHSPHMRFSVQQVHWPATDFPELRERKADIVLGRLVTLPAHGQVTNDIAAEVLFDDPFSVVIGKSSRWAQVEEIGLADLVDASWVCTPLDVLAGRFLAEAFEREGLKPPTPKVATSSIHLRNHLAGTGQHVAVLPRSALKLNAERFGLRELPLKLTDKPSPVAVMTLKDRTLTPAVEAFVTCATVLPARMVTVPAEL